MKIAFTTDFAEIRRMLTEEIMWHVCAERAFVMRRTISGAIPKFSIKAVNTLQSVIKGPFHLLMTMI